MLRYQVFNSIGFDLFKEKLTVKAKKEVKRPKSSIDRLIITMMINDNKNNEKYKVL